MYLNFPSQLLLLQTAILPYRKNWKKWTKSTNCFLKPDEVKVIDTYLKTGCYKKTCTKLGLSEINTYFVLKKSIYALTLLNRIGYRPVTHDIKKKQVIKLSKRKGK